MKKILFILCFFVTSDICGQDLSCPQLHFYSNQSPISVNSKNDVEEYDKLNLELQGVLSQNKYSDRQILDIFYRMYEIEKTSEITYSTTDKNELQFQCDESTDGIAVNFGTPLIENEKIYESTFDAKYKLRFAGPVTTIDPALFSSKVKRVVLTSSKDLTYKSSPSMMTTCLEYLEGSDVIKNRALISKDKTLIVAATNGNDYFQVPDGVLAIGAGAFRGSLLSSVEIPPSVTSIGEKAFDLSSIKHYFFFSETVPTISNLAFGKSLDEDARLYVPKKALGKYKKNYPNLKNSLAPIEKNKGIYYLSKGKEVFFEDHDKAAELFELAAKNKCHEANYYLGLYYTNILHDAKKGYSYYEKAAKKKHAKSMFMCHYYPRYHSDPKDMNAAIKWLNLAIKNNDEEAAFELGNIYSDANHEGYPLKLQEALEAYNRANDYYDKDILSSRISRVKQLITLGADKCLTLNANNSYSIMGEDDQFLSSYLQGKQSFCLFDMVIALMKEYDATEDVVLEYCKYLIDRWVDMGIISYK